MLSYRKKIKKIKRRKKYYKKKLARKTYISEETIRRIEKEENDPRISTLYSLCENLDVDLQLLLIENKKNYDKLIEIRKKVTEKELKKVEGGFNLKDTYEGVRDFVNNNLADLARGIRDGWKNN